MGCDIHGTIEKKVGDKWIMVNRLSHDLPALNRNYERFGALAGVRATGGPKPKGIPLDVSESTKLFIDYWGRDGHSHSYLDLKRAASIFLKTEYDSIHFLSNSNRHFPVTDSDPVSYYFGVEEYEYGKGEEYRLVFWFDN
jgi:hypothetical protein